MKKTTLDRICVNYPKEESPWADVSVSQTHTKKNL